MSNRKYLEILLIEDDVISAKMAAYILKCVGCQVYTVDNGEDACNALSSVFYDAVFIDLGIPNMGEIEIVEQINQTQMVNPNIVKIVLTVFLNNATLVKLQAVGIGDFLLKPLNPTNCIEIFRQHFPDYDRD